MTRAAWFIIIGLVIVVVGLSAATLIKITQIQGASVPANRVLTSTATGNQWLDPATLITVPAGATQVNNETPSGGPTSFVLANVPNPSTSLRVFRNGIRLQSGSANDYVLTGATLSLPQGISGDTILVDYQF